MGLKIQNRRFSATKDTGKTFMLANSNVLVKEYFVLAFDFDFVSNSNDLVQIIDAKSIRRLGDDWNTAGFVIGDSVYIDAYLYDTDASGIPMVDRIQNTKTIVDIQGDTIILNSNLSTNLGTITFQGKTFPQQTLTSQMTIENTTRSLPKEIEIYHNLIENSQSNILNSFIDGEVNRFIAEDTHTLSIGSTRPLIQQGKKSGGRYVYEMALLERLADDGVNKVYAAEIYYILPSNNGIDFSEFDVYESDKCLKSTLKIAGYPDLANPNSVLGATSFDQDGNTGGRNEEYNQGLNTYSISNFTIKNPTGDVLQALDFQIRNTVEFTISGDAPIDTTCQVAIEMIVPEDDYKSNQWSNLENTYLALSKFGTGAFDIQSEKQGGKFTISNSAVTSSGNTLTVKYDVEANANLKSYIDSLQTQERLYLLTCAVNYNGQPSGDMGAVTLEIDANNFQLSPIPDQPFNDVIQKGFLKHNQIITETPISNISTCTEDDIVFKALIEIQENEIYESLQLKVQVERISDGATFDLDSHTMNFSSVVNLNGVQQFNEELQLGNFLDAPDRNKIQFKNTGVASIGEYETLLTWPIFIDWEYWVQNSNAFTDFYDLTLPQNGQNQEWIRYLELTGYKINIRASLIREGIAYYIEDSIDIQDYDDSTEITTTIEYYDSSNNQVNALISGQEMKIRAIHVLSSGTWDITNTWGWIAYRPYENSPRKQISTVWDWSSQNLPLKPKQGQTKATITLINPTTIHVESLISGAVGESTVVARIDSGQGEEPRNYTLRQCGGDTTVSVSSANPMTVGKAYKLNELEGCWEAISLSIEATMTVTVIEEHENCTECSAIEIFGYTVIECGTDFTENFGSAMPLNIGNVYKFYEKGEKCYEVIGTTPKEVEIVNLKSEFLDCETCLIG